MAGWQSGEGEEEQGRGDGVSFELSSGADGEITAAVLGKLLGVTAQTVRNWTKAGMPARAAKGVGGAVTHWYRVDECRAWAGEHRSLGEGTGGTIKGGARVGAGRPMGRPKGSKNKAKVGAPVTAGAMDVGGGGQATAAGIATGGTEAQSVLPLMTEEEKAEHDKRAQLLLQAGLLSGDNLQLALAPGSGATMNKSEAERRIRVIEAAGKQLEFDKDRELLIETQVVEAAWGEGLTWLRTNLESLGDRVAPMIGVKIGLSAEQQRAAADEINAQVRAWLARLADMAEDLMVTAKEAA